MLVKVPVITNQPYLFPKLNPVDVFLGGTAYSHTNPRGDDAQNYRQKFGKGIKDRYYAIGASGTGDLTLDNLEFDIAQLTRRI